MLEWISVELHTQVAFTDYTSAQLFSFTKKTPVQCAHFAFFIMHQQSYLCFSLNPNTDVKLWKLCFLEKAANGAVRGVIHLNLVF